jgi:hypothetical protein
MPSDQERKAFLEKLGQFRGGLSQGEQKMLDAMAAAAFQPQPSHGDVQGYGWVWTGAGYAWVQPTFYQTGWNYSWQATPWGTYWQAQPAGFYTP